MEKSDLVMWTDFGFEKIEASLKTSRIKGLFDRVSSTYDLMNDCMSMGYHRLWKREFISRISLPSNPIVLDCASGTGDIALRLLDLHQNKNPHIILADLSFDMLRKGVHKAIDHGYLHNLSWVTCSGEYLPFEDHQFDAITISFGLRNVTDKKKILSEFYRCLKPNGHLYCLEFSKPQSSVVQYLYDTYSFSVIPKLGHYIAGDEEAYRYLVESIRTFPDQETLKSMMIETGFSTVHYHNFTDGIVALHTAHK